MASENRRIKRYLLRHGETRDKQQIYADNIGGEYEYKWVAQLSSFFNIIGGCLKNGFPIVVSHLRYNAWAFYPFFFVRKDIKGDPLPILNHERIHVRQQRDIHLIISLPLLILSGLAEWFGWFNPFLLLCVIPFIPTIIYGLAMIRSWRNLLVNERENITFSMVRENTSFEREAISRSTNLDYLFHRKFLAVLAYTGWKIFKNY